jgi:hypothetical protein
MTTLIVLDTTETFGDLRLEGPDYAFLRSYIVRHPASLIVPQIVAEETVNHFREQLKAAIDEVRGSVRAVGRVCPHLLEKMEIDCDLDWEVSVYRDHLQKQLKALLAKQPAYESIRISSLVARALARRKPFDTKGAAGFRDALIWETVLAAIGSEKATEVVLVTRNKRDFGEHGRLADDLAADLAAYGMSQGMVVVCEGLQRFVNERVKPSLETLDEIKQKLNEGGFEQLDLTRFFEDWSYGIRDELYEKVKGIDLERLTSYSVYDYHDPSLGRVEAIPEQYNVVDVWRISPTELGVGIDCDVSGTIYCFWDTPTEPYGEPWDEEYEDEVRFTLAMTLVFDEQSSEVESWEVNDFDVELTGDWGFPEND